MEYKVSVVVPVYNAERWLGACADSILAQTLQDIQLILVDDGSPDGSGALCDAYAEKDPRVRVIHKPNGGVASAVTAGIEAAEAAYIGFTDSDDWVDPGYFEELYTCAVREDADLVEGQFVSELDKPRRTLGAVRSGTVIYDGPAEIERLTGLYMASFLYDGMPHRPDRPLTYGKWDKLYRAQTLRRAMPFYDVRLSLGEDAVLNAAVLPECRRAVTLKAEGKYHHRILAGSVSHRAGAEEAGRIRAVWESLERVADEKGLDRDKASAFVGSMVHARIYRLAGAPDASMAEKRDGMRLFLKEAPAGALEAFVRMRANVSLRLFYGLLRMGLTAPCVWMVTAHSKTDA